MNLLQTLGATLALSASLALAAKPLPPSQPALLPAGVGHTYLPEAFTPTRLLHVGDISRLIGEFNPGDDELLPVRREDFGGDGEPEWLVVSPERQCDQGNCLHAMFDGKTAREIGRFYGTMLVLGRRQNGYPVIQALTRQDEEFSSLRTYIFVNATYQADDEILIGEAARLRLLTTLEQRR